MDMQNVAKLDIPEGEVRTIHDKDGNLIWGKVSYGVKYKGDTAQNGTPTPSAPVAVQTVTGENVVKINDGQNEQSYEVNLGKNLFDKNNASTIGAYIAGGTSTIVTDGSNTSIYIPCQPNTTYTISKTADNVFRAGTTSVVPANGATVKNMTDNASGTKITLTSASDAKYLVVFIRNNSSSHTAAELMASLQIELGSTATSYAAYFTPIELCKIGDYQDYIYKSGSKWYAHKEVGKVTLDGSPDESIVRGGTATSGKVRFNITVSGVANIGGSEVASYSDNFTGVTRNDTWNCVQGVAIGQNLVQIYYEATSGYDLDQFRAWLGSHNTTVYYALATPTDTEITNEALVGQLEAVEQWLTRYGYSATVSGNLPIIIDRTTL